MRERDEGEGAYGMLQSMLPATRAPYDAACRLMQLLPAPPPAPLPASPHLSAQVRVLRGDVVAAADLKLAVALAVLHNCGNVDQLHGGGREGGRA